MIPLRRPAAAVFVVGLLAAGCSTDDKWLTAQLVENRLVLSVAGQCDAHSYLSEIRVIDAGARPVWEVQRQKPPQPTPTVTLGEVPSGFIETIPAGDFRGKITVFLRTNFDYVADLDLDALGDTGPVKYAPRPVMNELSPVHAEDC